MDRVSKTIAGEGLKAVLVVVRGSLGHGRRGILIPDDLELQRVRGLHRGEDRLGDEFIGCEGLAGQDDLVSRQIPARSDRRYPAALDILPQDLPLVGLRQLDITFAGKADPQVLGVDERIEVGDDR